MPDDEPLVNKPNHRPSSWGVCGIQCVSEGVCLRLGGGCRNKIQPYSLQGSPSASMNVALRGHST